MEVIILPDSKEVARHAAAIVGAMLARRADAVLGLATGSTPIALYRELVARYRAGELSFRDVTTFNLDEYLGLESGSRLSYRRFMDAHLFDHIDIDRQFTHFPQCGPDEDPRGVGHRYEAAISAAGGIHLQLLGIGRNGHVGFNEPGSSLGSRTRVKALAPHTVADNSRLLQPGETQPGLAVTMGIRTILDARRILLLATGEHKAAAVASAVEGPITAMHPASALQAHPRVRVVVDEAAAAALELADYYRWVRTQSDAIAARYGGSADDDPWFHPSVDT